MSRGAAALICLEAKAAAQAAPETLRSEDQQPGSQIAVSDRHALAIC